MPCAKSILFLRRRRSNLLEKMAFVLLTVLCLRWFSDLPLVLPFPQQLYLPKGMMGRIDCSAEANPPVYLTVWSKNERVIDLTQTTRFKVNSQGTLVIKTITSSDEGSYACTPYSPLGPGLSSPPVQVFVRGKLSYRLQNRY